MWCVVLQMCVDVCVCVSVCVSLLFYFMVGDMYCVGETVECVCVCMLMCVGFIMCELCGYVVYMFIWCVCVYVWCVI